MADLQSHMDSMVGGGAAGDVVDHMEIEGSYPPEEAAISLPCFKPQVRVGGPAARRAAANVGIDAADPNLMGRREKIMKSAKAKDTLCQKVGAGTYCYYSNRRFFASDRPIVLATISATSVSALTEA